MLYSPVNRWSWAQKRTPPLSFTLLGFACFFRISAPFVFYIPTLFQAFNFTLASTILPLIPSPQKLTLVDKTENKRLNRYWFIYKMWTGLDGYAQGKTPSNISQKYSLGLVRKGNSCLYQPPNSSLCSVPNFCFKNVTLQL